MLQRVGKYRRGTNYELSFPTFPERKGRPSRIELTERQYGHDILKLEFNITSEDWIKTVKTGLPVKFQWTQGKRTRIWVGYVSYVSREKASQLKQRMTITCIGASFVLKQNTSRVFTNQTIIDVARIIARENKLSLSSDSGTYLAKYDQLTVSNESYWEWLVRRAKSMGYGLRITGTTLEFKPLQSFIDNASTDVPILQHWGERAPTETHALAPTLDSFKVISGDFVESSNEKRTTKFIGGINPRTGKEFFSTATPLKEEGALRQAPSDVLFNQNVTDIVSSDKDMARSKAEGAALLSRFSIPARAIGQGDPRIRPFSLVYVDGTGEESDGYWMVEEVTHVIEVYGSYHVDLKLLSDGAGISKETIVRPATASLAGTVNLNEVILSGRTKISNTPKETASLENRGQILNVGKQGFAKTPSRWISNTKEIM